MKRAWLTRLCLQHLTRILTTNINKANLLSLLAYIAFTAAYSHLLKRLFVEGALAGARTFAFAARMQRNA